MASKDARYRKLWTLRKSTHDGIEMFSDASGYTHVPITDAMRAIILATDLRLSASKAGAADEPYRCFISKDAARQFIDRINLEDALRRILA